MTIKALFKRLDFIPTGKNMRENLIKNFQSSKQDVESFVTSADGTIPKATLIIDRGENMFPGDGLVLGPDNHPSQERAEPTIYGPANDPSKKPLNALGWLAHRKPS